MLNLITVDSTMQHPNKWILTKLCIGKLIQDVFSFLFNSIYGVILASRFNLLLSFLHRLFTWLSKLRLLSILTPNNFSWLVFFIKESSIWISATSSLLTIKQHLSLLLFIWLSINYFKSFWVILAKMILSHLYFCLPNQ